MKISQSFKNRMDFTLLEAVLKELLLESQNKIGNRNWK